jgi:hypothetical protein
MKWDLQYHNPHACQFLLPNYQFILNCNVIHAIAEYKNAKEINNV